MLYNDSEYTFASGKYTFPANGYITVTEIRMAFL